MKPINFPGATGILGAPTDWDPTDLGPCAGLPISRNAARLRRLGMETYLAGAASADAWLEGLRHLRWGHVPADGCSDSPRAGDTYA